MSRGDDMMNRRQFIRKIGSKLISGGKDALGAYALFNLADNLPLLELLAQEMPASTPEAKIPEMSFGTVDDFVVLEKNDDAASLTDIIAEGHIEVPILKPGETFEVGVNSSRIPSPVYMFDIKKKQHKDSCSLIPTIRSMGSANIINDKGYVLTAYHVIESILKENKLSLIYNHGLGMVRSLRVVACWPKYDLALGKIDVPENFEFEKVCVSRGDAVPGASIYSLWLSKKSIESRRFIDGIFNTFYFDENCDPDFTYFEEPKVPKPRRIFWNGKIGKFVEEEDSDKEFMDKYFVAVNFDRNIDTKGYSGSCMYDLNGDIIGIHVKGDKHNRGSLDLSVCVKPNHIRDFISKYIYESTGKIPGKYDTTPVEIPVSTPELNINH